MLTAAMANVSSVLRRAKTCSRPLIWSLVKLRMQGGALPQLAASVNFENTLMVISLPSRATPLAGSPAWRLPLLPAAMPGDMGAVAAACDRGRVAIVQAGIEAPKTVRHPDSSSPP